jgi:hypothetical protein
MFIIYVDSGDAYWPWEQLPMHLHVYAYIVGHALPSWWAGLDQTASS